MWSFFLAIFGGTYWATKLKKERAALSRADAEMQRQRVTQDVWYSKVRDQILEEKIKYKPCTQEFIRQKEEALSLIQALPGLENAQFDFSRRREDGFYAIMLIRYIQMVKRGKLPAMYSSYVSTLLDLSINIRPPKKARIAFCKWVESSLQSFNVQGAKLYYTQQDYATFVWEPFVYDWNKAISVSDPSLEARMLGI